MSNISVSKYYLYKFQSTQTLDQITAQQHPALSQYYRLIFFFLQHTGDIWLNKKLTVTAFNHFQDQRS